MTIKQTQTEVVQCLARQLYSLRWGHAKTAVQILDWCDAFGQVEMSAGEIVKIAIKEWHCCRENEPAPEIMF